MAERKETPDILSEILSAKPAELPALQPEQGGTQPAKAPPTEKAKPAATTKPKTRRTTARAAPKASGWEYRLASFQNYHGWRLRYEDGEEVADWLEAPLMHEYLAQMAEQGWELAAATSGEAMFGTSDKQQLYFKRAR